MHDIIKDILIDTVNKTVSGKGISFKGEDFRQLSMPCVYIFLRDSKALYIGMSGNGIGRPTGRHNQAVIAKKMCDEVIIYPTNSVEDANKLEDVLIGILRPEYNQQNPMTYLKKLLDVTNLNPHRK